MLSQVLEASARSFHYDHDASRMADRAAIQCNPDLQYATKAITQVMSPPCKWTRGGMIIPVLPGNHGGDTNRQSIRYCAGWQWTARSLA